MFIHCLPSPPEHIISEILNLIRDQNSIEPDKRSEHTQPSYDWLKGAQLVPKLKMNQWAKHRLATE